LIGHVSGDKVSAKGISLAEDGGLLYARSGPGLEITCSGKNCSRCDLVIKNWKLQCTCDIPGAGPEPPQCDYFVRLIIAPW
ncbi:MAG TPA: hypothetical protein VJ508_03730, partial [Saprospiraceae bacterium]|nr:hypothetical protein [Saprospiraceae bacterium]